MAVLSGMSQVLSGQESDKYFEFLANVLDALIRTVSGKKMRFHADWDMCKLRFLNGFWPPS